MLTFAQTNSPDEHEDRTIGVGRVAEVLNCSLQWARVLMDRHNLGIRDSANRRLISPTEFSNLIATLRDPKS